MVQEHGRVVSLTMAELEVWSWLLWSIAAIVKFVVTPSAMVASGFHGLTTWLTTSAGASIGVWGFWHFGKWCFGWWESIRPSRMDRGKRVFTPGRRRLVRWKNRFGLNGILMVSGLISVPIAAVLAAKYFRDESWAMWRLMLAFTSWAGLLTALSVLIKFVST